MLLDNKKNGKVGDELRRHLSSGTSLSVVSALFSIYGFESLKKELSSVEGARLLLCPERDEDEDAPQFVALAGDEFELRFRNQLNQKQIAKECAKWVRDKAEVRIARNPRAFGR